MVVNRVMGEREKLDGNRNLRQGYRVVKIPLHNSLCNFGKFCFCWISARGFRWKACALMPGKVLLARRSKRLSPFSYECTAP